MIKRSVPIDKFIQKALYDPNVGYYTKKIPFGRNGDFITAPTISNLFSEIIAIWVVSTWEKLGKPNIFNFIELGPGDALTGPAARKDEETLQAHLESLPEIEIPLYESMVLEAKRLATNTNDLEE